MPEITIKDLSDSKIKGAIKKLLNISDDNYGALLQLFSDTPKIKEDSIKKITKASLPKAVFPGKKDFVYIEVNGQKKYILFGDVIPLATAKADKSKLEAKMAKVKNDDKKRLLEAAVFFLDRIMILTSKSKGYAIGQLINGKEKNSEGKHILNIRQKVVTGGTVKKVALPFLMNTVGYDVVTKNGDKIFFGKADSSSDTPDNNEQSENQQDHKEIHTQIELFHNQVKSDLSYKTYSETLKKYNELNKRLELEMQNAMSDNRISLSELDTYKIFQSQLSVVEAELTTLEKKIKLKIQSLISETEADILQLEKENRALEKKLNSSN